MSKAHRGRPLRLELPSSGRGQCPVTKQSGVKLLYDYEINGKSVKISKMGRAILENRRLRKEKEERKAELNKTTKRADAADTHDTHQSDGDTTTRDDTRDDTSPQSMSPSSETDEPSA